MSHPDRPSPHAGSADLRVGVIAGSTRPGRRALEVADWVCREHGVAGVELTVIDLAEVDLPILAEPTPAALGGYELDRTRQWSALVASFDAFVLVSPEYNHSTTAVLKNALDHLYAEWRDKVVAFVGYGVDGGVRAVTCGVSPPSSAWPGSVRECCSVCSTISLTSAATRAPTTSRPGSGCSANWPDGPG